jgi:hypothetical protein
MDPAYNVGLGRGQRAIAATSAVQAADIGLTIVATTGTYDLTATSAATLGAGFHFGFMNEGTGVVTFNPAGAETILTPAGAVATLAFAQGQGAFFESDGTNWNMVANSGFAPVPGSIISGLTTDRVVTAASATTIATPAAISTDQSFTVVNAAGIVTLQAATQDSMRLLGRAGGSTSLTHTQTSAALTGSRTVTWPDADGIPAISAAALTSGRIPYTTTGGLLTDNAGVAFNGTTFALTVPMTTSGNLTQTGATTHSTGTGAFTHNGNITIAGASTILSATAFAPTDTSGSAIHANWTTSANPASASSANFIDASFTSSSNAACAQNLTAAAGGLMGMNTTINHFGSGTLTAGYGQRSTANMRSGGGPASTVFAYSGVFQNLGASTGTVVGAFQAEAAANTGGGILTRVHGFISRQQTVGASNYGFFYGTSGGTVGNFGWYNNTADGEYHGTGQNSFGSTTDATSTITGSLTTLGGVSYGATKSLWGGAANHTFSTANTSTVQAVLTIGANSTGTAAAGFGASQVWNLKSTTTNDTSAALDEVSWVVATHASRTARRVFSIYDTAAREGFRIEASGSAPMIGFLGAAAVIRQAGTGETVGFTAGGGTTVTDSSTFTGNVGSTAYRISDIVKALKNLGLMAA